MGTGNTLVATSIQGSGSWSFTESALSQSNMVRIQSCSEHELAGCVSSFGKCRNFEVNDTSERPALAALQYALPYHDNRSTSECNGLTALDCSRESVIFRLACPLTCGCLAP